MGWIESFWARLKDIFTSREESSIPPNAGELIELTMELDLGRLEHLRFRRCILNWRDDSILDLDQSARELLNNFSCFVDDKLNTLGFLDQLFSRPAKGVLRIPFEEQVRSTLNQKAAHSGEKLKGIHNEWCINMDSDHPFIDDLPADYLTCLDGIGFKPGNRNLIRQKLRKLVFGDDGIFEMYRMQAMNAAESSLRRSTE
jgi:hypothetical protein